MWLCYHIARLILVVDNSRVNQWLNFFCVVYFFLCFFFYNSVIPLRLACPLWKRLVKLQHHIMCALSLACWAVEIITYSTLLFVKPGSVSASLWDVYRQFGYPVATVLLLSPERIPVWAHLDFILSSVNIVTTRKCSILASSAKCTAFGVHCKFMVFQLTPPTGSSHLLMLIKSYGCRN